MTIPYRCAAAGGLSRFAHITPTRSPAGKPGIPDGSRTSRAANATSTPGHKRMVTGAGGSKVARSASNDLRLERFAGWASTPDPIADEPTPTLGRHAPMTRAEFMRQVAADCPTDPKAAAALVVASGRAVGLISAKSAAQPKLPNAATDPGAYAVALARQAGVIR